MDTRRECATGDRSREVLFTEDVARLLGCSAATVERMRYAGRGPRWVRVGVRNIVYRAEAVQEWLREQEQGGAA